MSNDGWGKLPTNSDWPKKETPYDDTWGKPVVDWPKPAVSDSWVRNAEAGPLTPKPDPWAPISTAWPEIKMAPSKKETDAEFEAQWTRDSLEGANNRASVINSLRGVKDEYTIDRDGQLDNVTETVRAKKTGEPTGYYLAYSDGKWLHAILSGPYGTSGKALERTEQCWKLFTEDSAFKLAFDNKFNREGVYCAEIPLSAKRKGAYGVLTT